MKNAVRNVAIALSLALVIAGAIRGSTVPFAAQWPLYEALRSTAAIIFAVIGAWLAIAYPERLRVSLGRRPPSAPPSRTDGANAVGLLAPIVHSTIILGAVLAIGIIAPLIRELHIVRENVELFRGLSYATVTSLTLWQLWTVILTLVPADALKSAVEQEEAEAKRLHGVFHRTTPADSIDNGDEKKPGAGD